MKLVTFPHPTLRHRSKPVKRVDAELRKVIAGMFDLMYAAQGIGLAANQVDIPLRVFIVNLAAAPGEGEELVFINPVLSRPRGADDMEEGCLSIPGVYAKVRRPERIFLRAYDLSGEPVAADLDDMLARVVQHEVDHLDGVLFIDRLSEIERPKVIASLEEFETQFARGREAGEIPGDPEIEKRLEDWERKYA